MNRRVNSVSSPQGRPPLVCHWDERAPLPTRLLRPPAHASKPANPPAWLPTGPVDAPFDFCGHMRRLIADVADRCPELAHVDAQRLLISMIQARTRNAHGLQARITSLRFAGGRRPGAVYQVQRYRHGTTEFLYLLTFCLPRFLDQDFDGKFVTLFHELYHISPEFNGDLRRHPGRYALHSHRQRDYDRLMVQLARAYVETKPDADLRAFLRLDFAQLPERHGAIAGVVVPRPVAFPSVKSDKARPVIPGRGIRRLRRGP